MSPPAPWPGDGGPQPPLSGGGSGLAQNGSPSSCFGGNFGMGSYQDNDSFCQYIAVRYQYLENECGNFGTATLTIDPSLASIAQQEANRVAGGGCPSGQQQCDNDYGFLYVDPQSQTQCFGKGAMFTAPETSLDLGFCQWAYQDGGCVPTYACQFGDGPSAEVGNVFLYHYCNWDCAGVYGDPTTQPSHVGCGTAVDTNGVTWRVVKLGP